jgi:hypothetical protein
MGSSVNFHVLMAWGNGSKQVSYQGMDTPLQNRYWSYISLLLTSFSKTIDSYIEKP